MFKNRKDAGKRLAVALKYYRDRGVLILGIPRGGVEVAAVAAEALRAELSAVIVRKLPLPHQPETGFGALSEDGSRYLLPLASQWVSDQERGAIEAAQKNEIARRIQAYRQGKSLPDMKGRTVLLMDDGIAMGVTLRAALLLCRNQGASKVVVAVPVASKETRYEIQKLADQTIVLEVPPDFIAVSQAYEDWRDLSDSEVSAFLQKAGNK